MGKKDEKPNMAAVRHLTREEEDALIDEEILLGPCEDIIVEEIIIEGMDPSANAALVASRGNGNTAAAGQGVSDVENAETTAASGHLPNGENKAASGHLPNGETSAAGGHLPNGETSAASGHLPNGENSAAGENAAGEEWFAAEKPDPVKRSFWHRLRDKLGLSAFAQLREKLGNISLEKLKNSLGKGAFARLRGRFGKNGLEKLKAKLADIGILRFGAKIKQKWDSLRQKGNGQERKGFIKNFLKEKFNIFAVPEDSFESFLIEVFKKSIEIRFAIWFRGKRLFGIPILFLGLGLAFTFWVTVPLLGIGFFMGYRYRLEGIQKAATDVKKVWYKTRKRKILKAIGLKNNGRKNRAKPKGTAPRKAKSAQKA